MLLRCERLKPPMSQLGHSRPGRARIRSSYVCYAPKSGNQIRVLASAMTDYGGLMMPPPRSMHRRSRTAHLATWPQLGQVLMLQHAVSRPCGGRR